MKQSILYCTVFHFARDNTGTDQSECARSFPSRRLDPIGNPISDLCLQDYWRLLFFIDRAVIVIYWKRFSMTGRAYILAASYALYNR